ncbi:MAG: serpin family protein [Calditrichia bacterium]
MKILMLSIVLLTLFSCTRDFSALQNERRSAMRTLTPQENEIVGVSQNFGLRLFKQIQSEESPESNIFISPLSVSLALGMTMNGAAGETYAAMRQTLGFGELSEQEINEAYRSLMDLLLNLDPKVVFEIANSIWPRKDFSVLPSFLEVNQKYFDSEVRPLDFTRPDAVDIINKWISEKTHGKIENMLNAIPPDVVMYLINAIYFKGLWSYQFDKELTSLENFYISDQNVMSCQMMKISGDWLYYQGSDVQIIDLPYGDGLFSMTIFLPAHNRQLDDFITNLTPEKYHFYLNTLKQEFGTLMMPRLKINYKILMNDALKALGMDIAFSEVADFSRINGGGGIFISRVLHQSFLQVDEEGTEAAAATTVEMIRSSTGATGFIMQVDRPYILVIRERTNNTILFIGKIVKPQWEGD